MDTFKRVLRFVGIVGIGAVILWGVGKVLPSFAMGFQNAAAVVGVGALFYLTADYALGKALAINDTAGAPVTKKADETDAAPKSSDTAGKEA